MLERRERVALARAEELRAELGRLQAAVVEAEEAARRAVIAHEETVAALAEAAEEAGASGAPVDVPAAAAAGRHRSSATSYKPFLQHIASGRPERTRTIKLKSGRKRPRVLTAAQAQKILGDWFGGPGALI